MIHLGSIGPLSIDSRPQCVHELDEIAVRRRFGLQNALGGDRCEDEECKSLLGSEWVAHHIAGGIGRFELPSGPYPAFLCVGRWALDHQ